MPALTLDQLAVLDAIDRTGSFAGAARTLHRVPSAISYAVKGLEEALGVSLFDRSGHKAVLTPAGRQLLDHARTVLREAETLEALARELHAGWEPELRIVVDGALPLEPLMDALGRFAVRRIPTRLRVDVEYQEGVWDRFHHDDGDVMLLLDVEEAAAALPTWPLGDLEMVLVVSPAHPLGGVQAASREDLDQHLSLVVRDSARRFARTPREVFLGTPRNAWVSDFGAKHAALHAGLGFGWMPRHRVQDDLERGRLVEVPLIDGSTWTYHPRLVTRGDRPLGPAGQLLVQRLAPQVVRDS